MPLDARLHGSGVLPLVLPALPELIASAAVELKAVTGSDANSKATMMDKSFGTRTLQLIHAIEDVFTNPGERD